MCSSTAIWSPSLLRARAAGNVTVYLKGLSVPVILNITSGETDTNTLSQEIDSRLDLRAFPVRDLPVLW